jgi:hypothetical protein
VPNVALGARAKNLPLGPVEPQRVTGVRFNFDQARVVDFRRFQTERLSAAASAQL